MKKTLFVLSLIVLAGVYVFSQDSDFPKLTGPYLGQKPPGKTPELFAPGIVTVEKNLEHSAAVFSPDMTEVFWCTNIDFYTDKQVIGNLRLYSMKIVDGQWTPPQIFPHTKDIRVERPVFSPDGNKLYIEFGSDPYKESDADIYVVEKKEDGWSKPVPVSPLINSPASERLHCVTADGSLYFTRNLMTQNEEVLVSRFVNGKFTEPEKLGESYNSENYEVAIVISPYEEFMLIWQASPQRSSELNVSYKKADGSWSKRIKAPYYCGGFLALSPDGKYLFFENEGICWVDTSFIDELKPKDLK